MSQCVSERRARVYGARDDLYECLAVVGLDILPPDREPTGEWTLETTLDTDGVPATVTGVLAEHSLTIRTAQPQAGGFRVVATARPSTARQT